MKMLTTGGGTMFGFFKKVLSLNVSDRTSRTEGLDTARIETDMGGKGLGSRLLLDRNPVGVDPLAPESHLVMALGRPRTAQCMARVGTACLPNHH